MCRVNGCAAKPGFTSPDGQKYAQIIEGWGEAQPGNRFGSVVRAYARSGSEVGIGENRAGRTFPFSLLPLEGISFEFSVVLVSPGEI